MPASACPCACPLLPGSTLLQPPSTSASLESLPPPCLHPSTPPPPNLPSPIPPFFFSTCLELTLKAWLAAAVVIVEPVLAESAVGAGRLGALVDVAGAGGARVPGDTRAGEPVH